jgi:hypothetical protein
MSEHERSSDADIYELRREVAELKEAVKDLVEAWNAARGFLAIIKWSAGIGSAIAVIWATVHGGNIK